MTNVGRMALRCRPTRRLLNSSLLNRSYIDSSSRQRPRWSERFRGASAPDSCQRMRVFRRQLESQIFRVTAWLISRWKRGGVAGAVESLNGLDGLASVPILIRVMVVHTVEIAAIAGRDKEAP